MKVKEVMTRGADYISVSTTLQEAARKMRDLDCGFLPIGDDNDEQLTGVVSDRDIVIRALAEGLAPNDTVDRIKTDSVLYCYEDDDVQTAAESMHDQEVYRIIVLNNEQEKKLSGIVSFGDLVRHDADKQLVRAAKGIWA